MNWGIKLRLYSVEIPLHSVRAFAFHPIGNVTVYVERERRCSVSEVLLQGLVVVALLQGIDGVSVSQIVEASLGSADAFYNLFEMPSHRVRRDKSSVLIREDEVILVVERRAEFEVVLKLLCLNVLEDIQHKDRRENAN